MTLLFPGSFDPITLGHLDLIRRAAKLGYLIVAVANNPHKSPFFSAGERVALLHEVTYNIEGLEITRFDGLLAVYAQARGVDAILRGVRGSEDCFNEAQYAWHNRLFDGGLETILLPSAPQYVHINSRTVREAAAHIYPHGLDDGVLTHLVPDAVREALQAKFISKG